MNFIHRLPQIILLFALCFILFASPAFAHKVNIFAYLEGDTLYTESYFSDGRKVEGGTIEVYDSQGNKLLEGKTNKEGQFNFKPPKKSALKIVLIASMGHKNSCTISADELLDAGDRVQGTGHREASEIGLEPIKQIIETSLDERLVPIMRGLKKIEEKGSFRDLLGGIGYIFGIFGVVLYFMTKRKD